jgi:hypothetical protein
MNNLFLLKFEYFVCKIGWIAPQAYAVACSDFDNKCHIKSETHLERVDFPYSSSVCMQSLQKLLLTKLQETVLYLCKTQICTLVFTSENMQKVGKQDTFGCNGDLAWIPGLFCVVFCRSAWLQHFLSCKIAVPYYMQALAGRTPLRENQYLSWEVQKVIYGLS